ncbi:MAG: alpha-ketoacid dehydrogenase subunit beta [Chloroflexi bacterium]|nr:alpha-ketoacid dehydrogenase subunit beta [Chloroflexota bacterium]MCL5025810.1 alpha-ketoacid dehydrogenase subunit beta [Chloroflexota bacterium]
MREITYNEALREALEGEMRRDPDVFLMGEDVAVLGGVFRSTRGLLGEFGCERVRDTPLSESGFIGAGVGAALTGMRPVVELMFCDFFTVAMDQVVNQAAKLHYMTGGKLKVPLTLRTTIGAGRSSAAQHSQSLHAWFMHVPGLKAVMPSVPADVKGLVTAAIRDDNPVIVFEHKFLYNTKGPVPEGEYVIPLGVAEVKRPGTDVTVVATSMMVVKALQAAQALEKEGISVEVVDPRTLVPLDKATILESVKKTGRLVVADEGYPKCGFASEIAAIVAEEALDYLDAPVKRVTNLDAPIPFAVPEEKYVMPDEHKIAAAVRSLVKS